MQSDNQKLSSDRDIFFLLSPSSSSFAQWRYSNQWSNREVLLLLVENYTQYPALLVWNITSWGNFWRPSKGLISLILIVLKCSFFQCSKVLFLGVMKSWKRPLRPCFSCLKTAYFRSYEGLKKASKTLFFCLITAFLAQSHIFWIISGEWAEPSGTAMLGQPMTEPEQAPELYPLTKISLISKRPHGSRIRY